jgi:hypothetical protein
MGATRGFAGELERLIRGDGLAGLASNPAIFHPAIAGSRVYAGAIRSRAAPRRPPRPPALALAARAWFCHIVIASAAI